MFHLRNLLLSLCILVIIIIPVFSQDPTDSVYVCIAHGGDFNLIEYTSPQPVGLMFSRTSDVIVYSNPDISRSVDLIQVVPDTLTGTYRWNGTIAQNVNTINVEQNDCQEQYPDQLTGLNHTIALPIERDQSIVIRRSNNQLVYEGNNADFFADAIGLFFHTLPENNFPHFQLLGFSNDEDSTISISLPDFDDEVELYVVSSQLVSYVNIDAQGLRSVSHFIDTRERFISRLQANNEHLINSIMAPGNFTMYIAYGEEIYYEPHGYLELVRTSAFVPRTFDNARYIQPISCNQQLLDIIGYDAFDVPFFGQQNYSQYYYFDRTVNAEGYSSCENLIDVRNIRDDGIIEVSIGPNSRTIYYIASWLVEPLE